MSTKHEQIVKYIESLPVGSKISVRQVAKVLHVSEGTAYRAIKEAEAQGRPSANLAQWIIVEWLRTQGRLK